MSKKKQEEPPQQQTVHVGIITRDSQRPLALVATTKQGLLALVAAYCLKNWDQAKLPHNPPKDHADRITAYFGAFTNGIGGESFELTECPVFDEDANPGGDA